MTQQNKCDTCRRRKVKCDETRPTCGQCRKKDRPCVYEYSNISRFLKSRSETDNRCTDLACQDIHDERPVSMRKDYTVLPENTKALTIRSVREAKLEEGVFYTFNTTSSSKHRIGVGSETREGHLHRQNASIPRPIISREMYLCAKFSDLLGEKGANWNSTFLWGCWISSVPARLGRNAALDDAADCFISANAAHHRKRGFSDTVASRRYHVALVSLQRMLDSDDDRKYETETLAAVNCLLLVEEALAFRESRWQSHYKGLIQLLLARGPRAKADAMGRSLFYAALNHDFSESIFGGCRSVFDSTEWLSIPPPEDIGRGCSDFTCISTEIGHHMIQLPRLVALVRQVRENPLQADASVEALSLAEYLYCRYSEIIAPLLDAVLVERAGWVDTLDKDLVIYCSKSLDFGWYNIFEGLVRCCYVRILVLDLCMALRVVLPLSPKFDTASLEKEEFRCATLIAASVQYAEKQEPFTLGALVMRLPLQVVYGTWWRKLRDNSMEDNWERGRAMFMEEWCAEKTNAFIKILNGDVVSKSKLQDMYKAAAEGGPWKICRQKGPVV